VLDSLAKRLLNNKTNQKLFFSFRLNVLSNLTTKIPNESKKKEMIEILKEDINDLYLVQERYNKQLKLLYDQLSKNIEMQRSKKGELQIWSL
jgi:predicted DNA-binding protein